MFEPVIIANSLKRSRNPLDLPLACEIRVVVQFDSRSFAGSKKTITKNMDKPPKRTTFWRRWRLFRRTDIQTSQNDIERPPKSVVQAEKRSGLMEVFSIACGLLVMASVLVEDFDILPMVIHPSTREGIKAIGGIGVAVFIALEVMFGRFSSNADKFARDWYAGETERLRKENNETALLRAYRSVGDIQAFEDAMRPFSGTKYAMEVFVESAIYVNSQLASATMPPEIGNLQWQLNRGLQGAGWIMLGDVSRRGNLGFGVCVHRISDHPISGPEARDALAAWLDNANTATLVDTVRNDGLAAQGCTVLVQIGLKPETMDQHHMIRLSFRVHMANRNT